MKGWKTLRERTWRTRSKVRWACQGLWVPVRSWLRGRESAARRGEGGSAWVFGLGSFMLRLVGVLCYPN
jgi:hypothetical protein